MTVRELIEELELFAKHYGDEAEVVHEAEGVEAEPILSGGPNKAGDPPYIRIS